MRKRLIALLLAAALLCTLAVPVWAEFEDIEAHWARDYIRRATELELFNGLSDTVFDPQGAMTRGMFVTVLGRMAGVDPEQWRLEYLGSLFPDVNPASYYAPYVCWAVRRGVTNGMGAFQFRPGDLVTREQIAAFIYKYLQNEGRALLPCTAPAVTYSDQDAISGWAADAVAELTAAGIFGGQDDGNGGFLFAPQRKATRAECAAIFCRLYDAMEPLVTAPLPSEALELNFYELNLEVGEEAYLSATRFAAGGNGTLVWYSTDPTVARVGMDGSVLALAAGSAEAVAVTASGLEARCAINVTAPPEPEPEPEPDPEPAPGLANANMSRAEKLLLVYGTSNVSDPRTYYKDRDTAAANQVTIQVKVWDLNKNGEKYTREFPLTIHKNLAPTVQAIFAEIYALPEKPPIHSLGGWRWRSYETSEHNMGLAMDLNYVENPFVYSGNDPYAAGFKPGEDPYSIPIGGSIDKIFAKYGFTRGIYWRNGNKDYMHYSFFAT